MLGKKRNENLQFVLFISALSSLKLQFVIMVCVFRFGMGIEFREGSLLITSKNNHVAKKGEIKEKKDLCISLSLSNQKILILIITKSGIKCTLSSYLCVKRQIL